MFIRFSEEAQKILKKSKLEMKKLFHPFIGSEHVMLSILNSSNIVSNKLKQYEINYNIFKDELIKVVGIGTSNNNFFIYTPLLKRILENAIIDAKESSYEEVGTDDIFLSMLDEGEGVAIRILTNLGLNIDELYDEFNSKVNVKKNNKKMLINECSYDLTKKCEENLVDPVIGRDKEVMEIINILLRRNKNNPLLIGEAGVGKTAIVEELARRIVNGNVPDKLKNKRILSLSMASCVAGTKYRGEFEDKITKILKELENNDDIIVFIDEIHTIVGAGGAEGAIDASNIIKPILARGKIKLIGATTIKEYKETICRDKALNRRFQNIVIRENSIEETVNILVNLKKIYEKYHNVSISDDIIKKLVYLTDKYIKDTKNPDKSIDILDNVCTKVSLNKSKEIIKYNKLKEELLQMKKKKNDLIMTNHFDIATKVKNDEMKLENRINLMSLKINEKKKKEISLVDVATIIEEKTGIPIYEVNKRNNKLKEMKCYLKKVIIGQDEVIDILVNKTKKIMLGLKNNLPFTFLFVGKSGVGKTELVKEYSKYLNIPLIRLDMSEYKEAHSVSKIIGSPPGYIGYNDVSNVLEKIKSEPFSIILLDEIEKSCAEVNNLFLQAFDEGMITDAHGEKVSLSNTIIIMTSNIGSEKNAIGFGNNKKNDKEIRNILSTALVNRINTICYFNDLNDVVVNKILKMKLKKIKEKYKSHNMKIHVNSKLINDIIKECNYEVYGVRNACKLLEEKIDDIVIDSILDGNEEVYIS